MLTPKPSGDNIQVQFLKLDVDHSFHKRITAIPAIEKYGEDSHFAKINKLEEPSFLLAYTHALQRINLPPNGRVLNIGINNGDEFEIMKSIWDADFFNRLHLVGVDHCPSAINRAKKRFFNKNTHFHIEDINNINTLNLGRFDALISIGTLQSPSIDFKKTFMSLIQNHLKKTGSVILGFPNCRWLDTEVVYGAKAPNYPYSEMSLLFKDAYFCKKYLQQHKYRVTLTGKNYIFLTATKIIPKNND